MSWISGETEVVSMFGQAVFLLSSTQRYVDMEEELKISKTESSYTRQPPNAKSQESSRVAII